MICAPEPTRAAWRRALPPEPEVNPIPGPIGEALARHGRMLRTALGPEISAALQDDDVVEILLNPDGCLWFDGHVEGRVLCERRFSPAVAERIIRLVAAHVRAEVHPGQPVLSAVLPETGERFHGLMPPLVSAPAFAIRKRASQAVPLDRYVEDGILSAAQADFLRRAVLERQNILVAGGTSSGKTTLANALLDEIALTGDRVLVLEDTAELRCRALDHVCLRTVPHITTMADLVRSTLRLRPDRVVVGEVRGGEALDLVKVWGTGHPGGLATVHAGSAHGALMRIEQLIQEVAVVPPRGLIAEAIHVIVFLVGRGPGRRLRELVRVVGWDGRGYELSPELAGAFPPIDLTAGVVS